MFCHLWQGLRYTEKECIVRVRAFTTRPPIRSIYRVVLQRNRLDFVKIILLKSDNCVLTMRKRLFCNAKPTLLPCKRAAFGMQNNRFCNALIKKMLHDRYALENSLHYFYLCKVRCMDRNLYRFVLQ